MEYYNAALATSIPSSAWKSQTRMTQGAFLMSSNISFQPQRPAESALPLRSWLRFRFPGHDRRMNGL